jgi:hypothetical protein
MLVVCDVPAAAATAGTAVSGPVAGGVSVVAGAFALLAAGFTGWLPA